MKIVLSIHAIGYYTAVKKECAAATHNTMDGSQKHDVE